MRNWFWGGVIILLMPTTSEGNSLFRSADRIATEKRHLKRKWKAHITFENYKSQDKVAMHVPRRQSVALS